MSPTAPCDALQTTIDFLNTVDVESGVDELGDPQDLHAWLASRGLAPAEARLDRDDVDRARQVRDALRTVLRAHHGDDDGGQDQIEAANAVLGSVPLRLRFTEQGRTELEPRGNGIDEALGRLLAAIPAAAADGSWERTKICPSDMCQWAFYDQSRNRSRRWCSMEVCGNREKSKSFRARHAGAD